jgi:RNA polymerase sigma-70 factor (ECF subfamily)
MEHLESTPSDGELVAAAQAGSPHAFDRLLARHYATLLALLRSRDSDHADDAAQEAVILALRHLDHLVDHHAFRAWLLRIGCRCLADLQRRHARRAARCVSIERLPHLHPAVTETGPSDGVDERQLVRQVLAGLRADERVMLVLRHVAGYNAREMSQVLAISAGAAQRRLNRAEARFRRYHVTLTTEVASR